MSSKIDYTTQNHEILGTILRLPRRERISILQQLLFKIIHTDNANLIKVLREVNVSDKRISQALGIDPSFISRDFPKETR